MLNIGNKIFMNLQEAVAWLLENNALPFQSTANYVGNTEIAMSTLINPSPAKVRVGSIIFFADSKVSTVVGVTSNSFIVSDQYNDLVDDVVYVANVAQDASGHLIVTLSNGDTIDAGLIKQVTGFNIDASQHLIVSYNDGTSADLGSLGNYSNVDFIAKTFEQTQANFKGSNINFVAPTGLTITNTYNRIEIVNQVLYVIINFKIENNSGTTLTFANVDLQASLPHKYALSVIDVDGISAGDSSSPDYTFITGGYGMALKNGKNFATLRYNCKVHIYNRTAVDNISVFATVDDGISLDNGDYLYFTGRVVLTLL